MRESDKTIMLKEHTSRHKVILSHTRENIACAKVRAVRRGVGTCITRLTILGGRSRLASLPKPTFVALAWSPLLSATPVATPHNSASPGDTAIHFGSVTPMLNHVDTLVKVTTRSRLRPTWHLAKSVFTYTPCPVCLFQGAVHQERRAPKMLGKSSKIFKIGIGGFAHPSRKLLCRESCQNSLHAQRFCGVL